MHLVIANMLVHLSHRMMQGPKCQVGLFKRLNGMCMHVWLPEFCGIMYQFLSINVLIGSKNAASFYNFAVTSYYNKMRRKLFSCS